ncbi:VPA1269 family protein [Paraburkholderia sediminicola]|uniref:VPA1269 family protein n=1 Tax=Paraburkholderia sediminicola TaxID=458836 RepID=UPI0038BB57F3
MTASPATPVTATIEGLTVTSEPQQWCAARPATISESRVLCRLAELRLFTAGLGEHNLCTVEGVCMVLTAILQSKLGPRARWNALAILLRARLVLMPYHVGAIGVTYARLTKSVPLASLFVAQCTGLLGAEQSSGLTTILLKLWLCTAEARESAPNQDLLSRWVRFFLPKEKIKNRKWSEHVSKNDIPSLSKLGRILNLPEVLSKYSPVATSLAQLSHNEHFTEWNASFHKWLNDRQYASVEKAEEAFTLLQQYWCEHPVLIDPQLFFSAHVSRESIFEWVKGVSLSYTRARKLLTINQFIRAYVLSHPGLAIKDDWDDDELTLSTGYEWPLSNSDLTEISVFLGERDKLAQSNQKSLPEHLLREVEIVLTEDSMAWPKTRSCDWVETKNVQSGNVERVFCPVLPLLIRMLIKLPIRVTQARRLDSGEGDVLRYDLVTSTFVANNSIHAGYWERLPEVRNPRRGVLRQFLDNDTGREFCGFYINSNKTRDRKVLFSETSGYEMFWQHTEVIEIVLQMRAWQENYNPVDGPLPFSQVPEKVFSKASEAVAARKPAVFYLFRYPGGNQNVAASPPTSQVVRLYWYEVLAEVERRLAKREPNPPILIDSWTGKVPTSSAYHPHGLRLGGITRLAVAGVHPWILQNIVAGHASWVMTFYYIEPGFGFINEHLTAAYVQSLKNAQHEFAQFLTQTTIENVHTAALRHSDDALQDLRTARDSKSAYVMGILDHCICPNGQTRCDEGMQIIQMMDRRPNELRNAFGPVPNTVGGGRDCARCRFCVTGTPFLVPMAIKCSEISVAIGSSVERQRSFMNAIDALESARMKGQRAGNAFSVKDSQMLQSLRLEYKTESDVLIDLVLSLDANVKYLQEIRAANRECASSTTQFPILITPEEPQFRWELIHRFEAIDDLCKVAKWFKSVRVEPLANERLVSIMKIYAREGLVPPLALLDENEGTRAIEALTDFLRRRLDRQAVAALVDGTETFESLGIAKDIGATLMNLQPFDFADSQRDVQADARGVLRLPHTLGVDTTEFGAVRKNRERNR